MSEKAARTHSQTSNRAQNRGSGGERKVVFKGVLDNPFRIPWPSLPLNVQNTALDICLAELKGIAEYRRKRKRCRLLDEPQQNAQKRQRMTDESASIHTVEHLEKMVALDVSSSTLIESDNCPPISQHLIIGINEVTKRLESQIRDKRLSTIGTKNEISERLHPSPLQIILVCRADVNPPILVDHLPHLVAAYNSLQPQVPVILMPLPPGAELSVSKAVGLRKAAVLGIESTFGALEVFIKSIGPIPILTATWLASPMPATTFIPTHIKQTRTSAPKDMRAVKERRKAEKLTKKQVKRSPETAHVKSKNKRQSK